MHRHLMLQLLAASVALASAAGCNNSTPSVGSSVPGSSAPAAPGAGGGASGAPPSPLAPPPGPVSAAGAVNMPAQVPVLPVGLGPLPAVPVPPTNPMTPAKIALGRQLFSDTRLSGNRQMSCATCHAPGQNFTDGRPRSLGASGELDRNAPTVINSAFYQTLFWDGRAASLEEQASGPILAVREMNSTRQQVEALIQTEPDYQRAFQEVFGTPGTFAQVTQAIASFERTLVTGTSAFDRYARGDQQALSAQQKVGLGLFTGRASCTTCHTGPHFSDNLFHNLGVPPAGPLANDPGRFTVTENPRDTRAFRTASLRNVARTAPYFHNGSMATLREVVAFYNGGGGRDANRSNLIRPLRLSAAEQAAMVSFLNSLTDDG